MTKPLRRIVTGHNANNRSIIASDSAPTRVHDDLGEPGLVFHEIWNTRESPAAIDRIDSEPREDGLMLAPPGGGTRIRVLDIPPEDTSVNFEEVFAAIGGSDAHQGKDGAPHPNMHRTRSIDYGIVLEGEITLIVDTGETVVRQGDIVVQRGTNHAWANRSGTNCRIAFVLIDGVFTDGLVGS
jgi:mannose-6-phosphate isomerase-like protein (cupin superfamily)